MLKTFYAGAACLLAGASLARANCDTLKDAITPHTSGSITVTFDGDVVGCPVLDDNELEVFEIKGDTVTLTGSGTTTFTNVKFLVTDGASLIFDFDKTNFGPNTGYEKEDNYGGYMLQVLPGGYAEFSGEMEATLVENYRSVFYNEGHMEFKGYTYLHEAGTNLFRDNLGKLRFRDDLKCEDNVYLTIRNDGGSVRIAGTSLFSTGAQSFDGNDGGAFANINDGIAIFDGDAIFTNNNADENGGAVYNTGKMRFYGKAYFYDNRARTDGGAVANMGGSLKFDGAVQMTGNNAAGGRGGGLAVGGGSEVSFRRWTTIHTNTADDSGGAISIIDDTDTGAGSTVELRQSEKVLIENNYDDLGCAIEVNTNSEIIGIDTVIDGCALF